MTLEEFNAKELGQELVELNRKYEKELHYIQTRERYTSIGEYFFDNVEELEKHKEHSFEALTYFLEFDDNLYSIKMGEESLKKDSLLPILEDEEFTVKVIKQNCDKLELSIPEFDIVIKFIYYDDE